jgi:hypothetical protein
MSRVVDALLNIIRIMVDNPASLLVALGLVVVLIGWASGQIWVVALGLLISIVGMIASVGRGK